MSIQWFPGHMAKTRRTLAEHIRWVDVVIELGDARAPASSRNPLLDELLGPKPRLMLLNKSDLANAAWTEKWLQVLRREGPVFPVSAVRGIGTARIVPEVERLTAPVLARLAGKGVRPRPVRVMVVGIPNIGKSTLINQLAGGSKARTGNRPGVTRGNQWIRIHQKVELLDTPGLLWPKFEDPEVGRKLAALGTIKDEILDTEELANWLLDWLQKHAPDLLQRFGASGTGQGIVLEDIGRARGCLVAGGRVDTLKAAQILLREFRAGQLGKVTMDQDI